MKFMKGKSNIYAYNPAEHIQRKNKLTSEPNFDEVTYESVLHEIESLAENNKRVNKEIEDIKESVIKDM